MIPEREWDVRYTRRVRHSKSVTNWWRQTHLHLVFKTFLRCPADVSFANKHLKHVSQTSLSPKLTKDVFVTKTYGSLDLDQNDDGPFKCANGPYPIPIHTDYIILMGLMKFLWALCKIWWAQESLISILKYNWHELWIAYIWGPAKIRPF